MKKIQVIMFIVFIAGLLILVGCTDAPGDYDAFATCLNDSGAKVFGAYWCHICDNQKNSFGDSWRLVNYVECSLPNRAGQTEVCQQEGITGYPTWEFGDGTRVSRFIPLEELSERTGCPLE